MAIDDLPLVRQLIHAGAAADATDWDERTPAHVAATKGHLTILRYLLRVCAVPIDIKDHEGSTPLDDAIRYHNKDCVSWLVEQKAEYDHQKLKEDLIDASARKNIKLNIKI